MLLKVSRPFKAIKFPAPRTKFSTQTRVGATCATASQIEAYRRDGVVLLKGVLSPEEVEMGQRAVDAAVANPGPFSEFIGANSTWQSITDLFEGGDSTNSKAGRSDWTMFQDQFSTRRVAEMVCFVRESSAARIIAQLMDSKTAVFFYDHVIVKRPSCRKATAKANAKESQQIPWHQDLPYWDVDGSQIGSIWVPFDSMPQSAGVTWVLGSHRWGLFRPRHFVDASPYVGTEHFPDMPDIDSLVQSSNAAVEANLSLGGPVQTRTFAVEPGDVLAFDARIIHGSGRNDDPSGTSHRRVALRFGGDDAVYFKRKGETAIPTPDTHHGLAHGDRLACEAFPRVWPR